MTRPTPNGSSGRVLVVEDDEGIREMLKYNLVTAGFSVQRRAMEPPGFGPRAPRGRTSSCSTSCSRA